MQSLYSDRSAGICVRNAIKSTTVAYKRLVVRLLCARLDFAQNLKYHSTRPGFDFAESHPIKLPRDIVLEGGRIRLPFLVA